MVLILYSAGEVFNSFFPSIHMDHGHPSTSNIGGTSGVVLNAFFASKSISTFNTSKWFSSFVIFFSSCLPQMCMYSHWIVNCFIFFLIASSRSWSRCFEVIGCSLFSAWCKADILSHAMVILAFAMWFNLNISCTIDTTPRIPATSLLYGDRSIISSGTQIQPLILLLLFVPSITHVEVPIPFLNDPSHTAMAVPSFSTAAIVSPLSVASKFWIHQEEACWGILSMCCCRFPGAGAGAGDWMGLVLYPWQTRRLPYLAVYALCTRDVGGVVLINS